MKRLLLLLVTLSLVLSGMSVTAFAQDAEAPEGVFPGTWDYTLPPEHHFNGFAEGGPGTNLGIVYRQMVEMPPAFYLWAEDRYEPMLAESWGFDEENNAYTLTLRADATWSDGSPVTSADVVATYALGRILGWAQFNDIDEVSAVDDQTVSFHFINEPSLLTERLILKEYIVAAASYGDLVQQAQDLVASGADSESEEWTAMETAIREHRPEQLLASGPYTYTLDDVGDSVLTLHWQPNSIFSDSVNFGQIQIWKGETESTTPLVLDGTIAHSTNVYPPSTQQTFENAGIRLLAMPRGYGPALLFNHDVYPWNVKEVRQATAMIINRAENAFLTNGFGATPTIYMAGIPDEMVPIWLAEDAISQLDRYEFDTDRAAELLESAGFSRNEDGIWADADGVTISSEFKFPAEFVDFSGAAQNATDQMNAFGFDITARAIPWQQSAEDIREGAFELSVWSWAAGSPFPSRSFFGPVQRFNYVGLTATNQRGMNFPMEFEWNGEQINLDELINTANAGLDLDVQRERVTKIALIINDLMPFVPLNYIQSTEPWNESIIAGGPADGDPILQNPSSDHFVIWYLLNGILSPA